MKRREFISMGASAVACSLVSGNAQGKDISLAPGQTFITAVPNYGSVAF
jgi:hypothetical protein